MRLSDLIIKGGKALDQPVTHVKAGPMSDPIIQGGKALDQPVTHVKAGPMEEKPRMADTEIRQHRESPLGPAEPVRKPSAGQPGRERGDKSPAQSNSKTIYENAPQAIYEAASQLKIPIPQNTEQILNSSRILLSKIFGRAIDQDDDKVGLWEMTRDIARDLMALIALDSNFARVLRRHAEQDERPVCHCINTALLAMDLAKEMSNVECATQDIGAAALVHDLGMLTAGLDYNCDKDEPNYRDHVAAGVKIVETMKVPELVKTMIAQHHERIDGKGFPAGLSGNEIYICSQIVSLADGFEHIIDKYNGALEGDELLEGDCMQSTLRRYRDAFDPGLLKMFISLQGFYLNGTMVELTNRAICVVVKQNEGFPLRPVVQLVMDGAGNHPDKALIIDLKSTNTLSVIRTVTQNFADNKQA